MSKKKVENIYNTVIKNGYDVRSGTLAVIDENLKVRLNQFGEYEYDTSKHSKEQTVLEKIALVSAMSDSSPNEDFVSKELYAGRKGIIHHPTLGYYSGLYVGYVAEGDYRANASSGGLTTWILVQLLEKGLIDGVIHAHKTKPGSRILFEYGISTTKKQIIDNAKTRYYPLELSKVLKKIKKTEGRYAVVGIPSLIMELRLLARVDKRIKAKIPYMIGLVCGHQKSTLYTDNLAWQCGIAPKNLTNINYRLKDPNMPSNQYSLELQGKINDENITITKNSAEFFGGNWGHGFFKTKFSDYTDDAFNETADLVLGDAWLPEYTKDSLGNNIIIVRNLEIQKIIDKGVQLNKLKLDKVSEETILRSQRGLTHHIRDELPYRLQRQRDRGIWVPRKRIQPNNDISKLRKSVQNTREKIAAESPEIFNKAVEAGDWKLFHGEMNKYTKKYAFIYKIVNLTKTPPKELFSKVVAKLSRK